MEQGFNVVNEGVFKVNSGWLELEGHLRRKNPPESQQRRLSVDGGIINKVKNKEKNQKEQTNLLHRASVFSQHHPQLEEAGASELLQSFRRLSGVGLAAPGAGGLRGPPLLLAQQHREVEAGSPVQLVVHLQAGAADLDQRGVGGQGQGRCCRHASVISQLGGQGGGQRSQAEDQLAQGQPQQLHRTRPTGDVITQHHTHFAEQDSQGQPEGPEHTPVMAAS